jgi:cytochrome c556
MAMRNAVMFAAAAALAGCVAVSNREVRTPAARDLSPQQIVAARQASFHLSGAAMGNMKAVVDSAGEVSRQAYAARGVARWARVLPTMFPDSTRGVTPTRARPEIFADRADFEAKAAAYAEAADRLAAAAQAGDREAFAAAHRATGATCAACHELYQAPAQR